MAAPKGNQFWKASSAHGRRPKFDSPDQLWEACVKYFEWVEDNPLWEEKLFHYQGKITRHRVSKMRAMTLAGLCLFLDIAKRTWDGYCEREDFLPVTTRAREIIYIYKFAGAVANLLNANIIARELGLAAKKQHSNDPDNHLPVPVINVSRSPERALGPV